MRVAWSKSRLLLPVLYLRCSYFLRAQLLLQLVTRLQVQLVKQQALGFSALRSHAAIVGARNAAAKATIPENETLRSTGVFEADSTYCVSATTAAAASERLQQLLDMSSDMLDRQHQSLSELASCQKPLLYLPQPFAAEHAARAAAAVTQNSYPVRAPPSLLSQETSDGEDGCFLPSASPQPTLLQLGPCGPRSQGFTQHAADKAFDHGIPFGVSVTTPSADPPTGIADYRPQTRLVQPVVNLSQGRGSASSSSNFFASSHVLDDADCSAHEAGKKLTVGAAYPPCPWLLTGGDVTEQASPPLAIPCLLCRAGRDFEWATAEQQQLHPSDPSP